MGITVTPHLWFDTEAEEAANLYCSIFPNSRIREVARFENTGPDGNQTVTQVDFEVAGQRVLALNAGPDFKLNEAFSFFVECDTQEEVDEYWNKLTADGGAEVACGWLKDRYGVSWQIIPKLLGELITSDDKEAADRAMQAMLKMVKIESEELLAAYENRVNA